jgi:hypothetical protein
MNPELLEHELAQLNDKRVVVVRPGYGTQSDSWGGSLYVLDGYPVRFHFAGTGMAIMFSVDDVVKLDEPTDDTREVKKIIRLKGPHDYAETYQEATH